MSQRGSTAAAAGAWGALIEAVPLPNRAARVVGTEADEIGRASWRERVCTTV